VYFALTRLANEGGDNLAGNVHIAGVWYEYEQWQIGSNYA
jgi:hypothetical protein